MDWLKELLKDVLEADKIDAVVESFKKEFPKHAVPKKDFNEKIDELKLAKAQIDENKAMLDDLTKKAVTVEEYEKNLKEYKTKYEQLEKDSQTKIDSIKKKTGLQLKLNDYFVDDAVPLMLDKINLDEILLGQDGDILEFDKHVAKLKDQYPKLAKEFKTDSTNKAETKETKDIDTTSMSDEEYYKTQGVKPLW